MNKKKIALICISKDQLYEVDMWILLLQLDQVQ